MASFRTGRIVSVTGGSADLVRAIVETDAGNIEADGFPELLGSLAPGDRVVVNTTGIDLGLGTGGVGFLLWNLDGSGPEGPGRGHIMKMRYTPWQHNVLAAEEPSSPHHEQLGDTRSLHGLPVVACGLHSQLAGVAAGIKAAAPQARVGYLMSDGGALPLAWSRLVKDLRAAGLLDVTCTHGHAFGGDLEAVTVFSGLVALATAGAADVVVAAMGPGSVGTGTALGTTALEQGQVLDAAGALDGRPFATLRISFSDRRERHRGVSHHSLTSLMTAARGRCTVVVPRLELEQDELVSRQLRRAGVAERHTIIEADGGPGLLTLQEAGVTVSSMGRSPEEDPSPFLAAAAAGTVAGRALDEGRGSTHR